MAQPKILTILKLHTCSQEGPISHNIPGHLIQTSVSNSYVVADTLCTVVSGAVVGFLISACN